MFMNFYALILGFLTHVGAALVAALRSRLHLCLLPLELFTLHIVEHALQFASLNSGISIIVVDIDAADLSTFQSTTLTQEPDDISFRDLVFLALADIERHHAGGHRARKFLRNREVDRISLDIFGKGLALA